ncbi:MAG: GumC family protein, partial [Pseudomonadota bacterium]
MQDPRLPAPDIDETEAGSIDLRGISRVLLRHKWSILCLTALICVIAALLVYRQTPIYQATATILIERFPVSYGPIQDPYIAFTEHYLYYETQYGLIKRRAIGERVVDDLGLYQPRDPDAPPPAAHSGFSWKSIFPDDWFPPPQPPTERQRYEGAVSSIVGGISVSPRNRSQLVDIRYQSADPLRAAEIANAVAEAFIEDGLEGRLQMTEQASSYLTERLSELRLKLEASESALQDFLDREQLLDVEGVDSLAGQELTLATEKLSSSRERRRDIESTFRAVQAASTGGDRDLATIPGIADQPEVRQLNQAKVAAARSVRELSTRYGPLHPRMVEANNELDSANEALDRQLQIAVETITGRYRTAVADERLAEDELDQTKDRFREIDRKEFRLEGLQREVDTNRQIFEKFQTQYKETDAAGGVRTANARIIEPARVPGGPIKPNKKRSIMLAFFMGLALSIGLAFL